MMCVYCSYYSVYITVRTSICTIYSTSSPGCPPLSRHLTKEQRVLNDLLRTRRLYRRRMIWLLLHPLPTPSPLPVSPTGDTTGRLIKKTTCCRDMGRGSGRGRSQIILQRETLFHVLPYAIYKWVYINHASRKMKTTNMYYRRYTMKLRRFLSKPA
jgi:hypothetical protein